MHLKQKPEFPVTSTVMTFYIRPVCKKSSYFEPIDNHQREDVKVLLQLGRNSPHNQRLAKLTETNL